MRHFSYQWYEEAILVPALCSFAGVTVIQIARYFLRKKPRAYRVFWLWLVIPSSLWCGVAMIEFLFNFFRWDELAFAPPALVCGALVAKTRDWLPLGRYLLLLVTVFVLQYLLACGFEYLVREFSPPVTPPRGNAGGGGMSFIGHRLDDTLSGTFWILYKLPGVLLFVCLITVPPRDVSITESCLCALKTVGRRFRPRADQDESV